MRSLQGKREASLAMQEALGAVATAARRVDSTLSILKQVQVRSKLLSHTGPGMVLQLVLAKFVVGVL